MAKNGISTLDTKEQRQIAKLDLAAQKRGESYDRDLLPTKYVGDTVVYNTHPNGLVAHRPWTAGSPPPPLTPYAQRTNYAFDFVNPPTTGSIWNDDTNQVTAYINGAGTRTSAYGRGIVFDGTSTYLEISDITSGISTLTISMAADFESANSNWNVIYSGGNYGGTDVFAYITGGNTDSISVGTGSTFEPLAPIVNNGLAWWDFVYDGTNLTVYKNGFQILSGVWGAPNEGFRQNLLVGQRYGSGGDFLNGTIYRIKCVLSALNPSAIQTQYNSIRSTYSLPPISGTQITAYTDGWNLVNNWLLPDVTGNPNLLDVTTGWTVSGPSGYTATVTAPTINSGGANYVVYVDTTPPGVVGNYTFTAP